MVGFTPLETKHKNKKNIIKYTKSNSYLIPWKIILNNVINILDQFQHHYRKRRQCQMNNQQPSFQCLAGKPTQPI